MAVIDIIPGVKVYQDKDFSILFGCPPEIIKHLIVQNVPFPDYIVIPDTLYRHSVLQNATEFPLYYFLFVQGHFFKGKKLSIIGQSNHIENNRRLLSLTLLGPTKEEYQAIGDSPFFDGLYKESRALSVKDKEGKEIPIDGLVDFLSFQKDKIDTGQFSLSHEDLNVYKVKGERIDINFTDEQIPPYNLNPDFVPMRPEKFGVDVLGGASGFSARNPCSGLVLNYNSDHMLIDCVPYLEYSLNARGISKQQIKSIFLSHIHDDHCNIFPLILFNNKIKFLGTKEVFWMACRKLALMTQHETSEFYSYFDFIELEPYQPNDFYGITITPHYTVHSIPTIGATFSMLCEGHERDIVFVGDNKNLPDIKKMVEEGSVSQDKYDRLLSLYRDRHDILFADGGMGLLHGDPRDSLESKSDRVVFLHLEKLPAEFDTTFTLATHGKRFAIQDADDRAYLIKTMLKLNHHFPGISEEWETTLLSKLHIVKYNKGDVIMKQGSTSNGVISLILSGNVSVLHHNGKELREVSIEETGDLIGDMAVVNRVEERSASVVARTPVTLCQMHENLFYSFIKAENRIDDIKRMWKIRSELEVNYPFTEFSDVVNQRIARVGKRLEVSKDEVVINQGDTGKEFYIILSGSFSVWKDGKDIDTIGPGEMFGEHGSLADRVRNATVKAKEKSILLQIGKQDIGRIIELTPALGFHLHQMMRARDGKGL